MAVKVYLSGSFAARDVIAERADDLRHLGVTVTSSWLEEPPITHDDPAYDAWLKRARANEDVEDVRRSDMVVVFTEWPSTSGGLHVETGMAISERKPIMVVGPRLNVFQYRSDVTHHEEWGDALLEFGRAP